MLIIIINTIMSINIDNSNNSSLKVAPAQSGQSALLEIISILTNVIRCVTININVFIT